MRVLAWMDAVLLAQRGHLFAWLPVCFALGIGCYFALGQEPELSLYAVCCAGILALACAAVRWPGGLSALAWGAAMAGVGFCVAGTRAHLVAAPVLPMPHYYGPVEGRVVMVDRSASDAARVTLDRVYLANIPPAERPTRVRVSLHGDTHALKPGQVVMTTARLSQPQGPAEPGGFDFRRHSWFLGLGAVGYSRMPVLTVTPAVPGRDGLVIQRIRMQAAAHLRARLGGDVGGFAAAVTTGDRSGVSRAALDALRGSNLAHLLAISGLHMGLLAGFMFGALRLSLAVVPPLALRLPVRKIAACGALAAAGGYLALSGGNVATERAFVMTAVVLGAVLFDRRAFSLRAVAMAALIVLFLRPEALTGPGFQMSFAATTALIAVFGALRDRGATPMPRWLRPILGVVLSSAVAGLATAPVGAAHFNTLSHFGLLANLVSVPVMGLLVIPAAVCAVLLAPFGFEGLGLYPMGLGLRWILYVAEHVAALPGAQSHVVQPPGWVLPVLGGGGLWVILWQGRARWGGLAAAALALAGWVQTERPDVLIEANGALVGVMTPKGRALSKARGAGFVARIWLENDGDGADQVRAAARWPETEPRLRRLQVGDIEIVHVVGKRGVQLFAGCDTGQIVVASAPLGGHPGCPVYDPKALRKTGSIAIRNGQIITSAQVSGQRIWHGLRTQ